jgi:Spy/CpxP family protein refolding chaperone
MKAFRDQPWKDGQALRDRMRTARQALQSAMRADVPDEAAVKAAAGAGGGAGT